jgi:hypothetical protein
MYDATDSLTLFPGPAQTLAAGYMGSEYLAAQSIIMQFAMYTILLPFSIGVAGMDTADGLAVLG